MVLNLPLVGCFGVLDILLQVRPGRAILLRIARMESSVAGLQEELYILSHPRLVVRKHPDPFHGGHIVPAAFYVA